MYKHSDLRCCLCGRFIAGGISGCYDKHTAVKKHIVVLTSSGVCQKFQIPLFSFLNSGLLTTPIDKDHDIYCSYCLPMNQNGTVSTRQDWIRESVPWASGAQNDIVADQLLDMGRQVDADYMRGLSSR